MTKALDQLEWLPDQLDAVPAKRHLLVNLRENALTNQHDDSCFFTVYSSWESISFLHIYFSTVMINITVSLITVWVESGNLPSCALEVLTT